MKRTLVVRVSAMVNEMIDSSTLPDGAQWNAGTAELGNQLGNRPTLVLGFLNPDHFPADPKNHSLAVVIIGMRHALC
jgi:hypothetical protein